MLNFVHYITDGPSSQYKNHLLAHHQPCRDLWSRGMWQFLETGHGKGPCDGVGGKMAKEAMAIAKFNIRNAPTMYLWSIKMERSVVNYAYVDIFDYHVVYYDYLPMFKKVKAVPGTLHH